MTDEIALYAHFPFCQSRCHYCSFVSFAGRETDIPAYVNALEEELTQRARGEHLSSIFLGGGTPSLLSVDQLAQILLRKQEKDGSWFDYMMYDYHQQYGTAFAVMSLARCRRVGR